MSKKDKTWWQIILEELLRAGIAVVVPLAVNSLISKNKKSEDPDKKSSDEILDDFTTGHNWDDGE